jgi:hypothetical protein
VLVSGQAATGISLSLIAASVLDVQVRDSQNVLKRKTKDGRRPDLAVGVWGPRGLYYPARLSNAPDIAGTLPGAGKAEAVYTWRLPVPRDTPLALQVSSRDLKLGDAAGAVLTGSTSRQTFQHAGGDQNPKSFVFTVLGLLP